MNLGSAGGARRFGFKAKLFDLKHLNTTLLQIGLCEERAVVTRRTDAEFEFEASNASRGVDLHQNFSLGLLNDESSSLSEETDSQTEPEGDGVKCARGGLVAICIELVGMLCIYALWWAWRLFR